MPIHDWTRVHAGTFHDFHTTWMAHLKEALNRGVLPGGYSAMIEKVVTRMQTDVLTLRASADRPPVVSGGTGLAVAEALPRVRIRARPQPGAAARPRRRSRRLTIRHVSDHRVVAVL